MEVQAVQTIPDPQFLLEWPSERRRAWRWVASVALHVVGVWALTLVPPGAFVSPERSSGAPRYVTPLIAPPSELTQKARNEGTVGHEFTLESLLPRPRILVPPGALAMTRARERAAALPEPPKVDASVLPNPQLPQLGAGLNTPPPPPQIKTEETPKLAFETPGMPTYQRRSGGLIPARGLPPPSTSVSEATRSSVHSSGASVAVGDLDLPGTGGFGPGLNQPSAPGRQASALELLSDPMGVDFKPYLIRILASVKRNWLAVIPESARLGRAGRVQIQFIIARDGTVPKLVIALPSGTEALDRAAVAGVSASTPFPPLPDSFQGQQVRLQFTFTYNLK